MDVGKLSTSFAEGHIFYFILHGPIVDETRRPEAKQYYYVVTETPSCETAFYFLCHSLCDVADKRRLQRWHAFFSERMAAISFEDFACHVRRAPQWNSASNSAMIGSEMPCSTGERRTSLHRGTVSEGAHRVRGDAEECNVDAGAESLHGLGHGGCDAAVTQTDAIGSTTRTLMRAGNDTLALTVCPALYLDETSARAGLASYVRYRQQVQRPQQQQQQYQKAETHPQQPGPPGGVKRAVGEARIHDPTESYVVRDTAHEGDAPQNTRIKEPILPACLSQLAIPHQNSSTPENKQHNTNRAHVHVGAPCQTASIARDAAPPLAAMPNSTSSENALTAGNQPNQPLRVTSPTDIAMHNQAASLLASAEEMITHAAAASTDANALTSAPPACSSAPVLWQALMEYVQMSLRQAATTAAARTAETDTLLRQEVNNLRAELQRVRAERVESRTCATSDKQVSVPKRDLTDSASPSTVSVSNSTLAAYNPPTHKAAHQTKVTDTDTGHNSTYSDNLCDEVSRYDAALHEANRKLHDAQNTHTRVCAQMQCQIDQLIQNESELRREHAAQLSAVVRDNRANLARIESILRNKEKELRTVYDKALQTRDIRLTQLTEQVWRLEHGRHRMVGEINRLRQQHEVDEEQYYQRARVSDGHHLPCESSQMPLTQRCNTQADNVCPHHTSTQDFLRSTGAAKSAFRGHGEEETLSTATASVPMSTSSAQTQSAPLQPVTLVSTTEDLIKVDPNALSTDALHVVRYLQNELQNAHALINTLRIGLQTVKNSLPTLTTHAGLPAS